MPTDLGGLILSRLLDAKRNAQEHQKRIREAISEAYAVVQGDPRFCVRRLEVVEHVARALGIRVLNNRLFLDVEAAAESLGFQPIRNGGRSLFRCAK